MAGGFAVAIAVVFTGWAVELGAQQAASAVRIDNDDIGGVVTGPSRARGRRVGDRGNDRSSHEVLRAVAAPNAAAAAQYYPAIYR